MTAFPIKDGATVYVDGVAQGNVTVMNNTPTANLTDMGTFFMGLDPASTDAVHIPKMLAPPASDPYSGYSPLGIYYNPYYEIGIASFYTYISGVQVSNDLVTWVTLATSSSNGTINVSASYQHYKYWKVTNSNNASPYTFKALASYVGNVIFDTPPASGAVITADYTPRCIAKDANHVFDFTFTIQLGEYTS